MYAEIKTLVISFESYCVLAKWHTHYLINVQTECHHIMYNNSRDVTVHGTVIPILTKIHVTVFWLDRADFLIATVAKFFEIRHTAKMTCHFWTTLYDIRRSVIFTLHCVVYGVKSYLMIRSAHRCYLLDVTSRLKYVKLFCVVS